MSIALRRPKMSVEEFLDWESQQELRWEFDGFEPVAMVGTTLRHNEIVGNIFVALRQRLGGRCRVYREEVRLRMAHTLRYPDVMVVCSRYPDTATWVTDPVVVFEVLSESTSKTDRIAKTLEYQATPSIQTYVLLEQDVVAATVLRRSGQDWTMSVLLRDDLLTLAEIETAVPVAEFYAGLDLEHESGSTSA